MRTVTGAASFVAMSLTRWLEYVTNRRSRPG